MIAVLGGLGAAVAWGISTLAYAHANRFVSPTVVLGWVMGFGLALVVPLIVLFGLPVSLTPANLFWLCVVGLGNAGGLLLVFIALRAGAVGIVATITSTEGAITAVIAVATGDALSLALAVALAVIVVGVVLSTIQKGEAAALHAATARRAALFAVAAALAFGVGLYAAGRVDDAVPVVWVLVPSRLLGAVAVALPLALRGGLRLPRPALPAILGAAVAEVVGFTLFAIAARESVAVGAVLASQFAVITLLVAFLRYGERVGRIQLVGIASVVAGVAAVAALRA